jgi:hypothetical protein
MDDDCADASAWPWTVDVERIGERRVARLTWEDVR